MIFNRIFSRKTFSIKQKMFSFILLPVILIFIAAFTFILFDFRIIVKNNTQDLIQSKAIGYSTQVEKELNYYIELNRFIKQSLESFENIPMPNRRAELSSLLYDLLYKNPKLSSIWSIWELNSIDTLEKVYANKPGSTILGNFRYLYYRDGSEIKLSDYVEQNPNNVFNGKLYNSAKNRRKEVVVTHYYLDYNQTANRQILQTNIVMPLYKNREFLGVVGVDMELESIQQIIQQINTDNESQIYLFSNNGMCISSPADDDLGEQIDDLLTEESLAFDLMTKIKEGASENFYHKSKGSTFYYSIVPIKIGKTNTPWSLLIKLPYSYIKKQTRQSVQLAIWGGLFGTVLIVFILIYISNNISVPLIRLRQKMDVISKGEISESYEPSSLASSEIKAIAQSYNKIVKALQNSTEFAQSIKNGDLNSQYDLLSENDKLGKSLLAMREQLVKSRDEQQKNKEEEQERYWISDGLAKLNEILRKHENLEDFSYKILSYLVNYLNANQGGIFIRNLDENLKMMELKAYYAFNRRKFIQKSFEFGEGLVGMCALEKQIIHLTEIPDNYIQVTSGLGGANPRSLILIPMKIEEDVLGVIEIASFNSFEQYQIDFLEQASLSIASALNMAETNKRTQDLLERTQQQAEEMAAQEEEMRQNMEELQATQEESSRRAEDFEQQLIELQNEKDELDKKLNDLIKND